MVKWSKWGTDSEWSHGQDFLMNLAKKFEFAEELYRRKMYIELFEELKLINLDVIMFLNDEQMKINFTTFKEARLVYERLKRKSSQSEGIPAYLRKSVNTKITNEEDTKLYEFFCTVKRLAKERGLVTKISKDGLAAMRETAKKLGI